MENKWLTRVKEHYNYVCEKYGKDNVLGVFLYGSQNYGLATEESDVDTKAILIPILWDIAANKQPVSKELHMENGEHIEVKDIQGLKAYMKQLKKAEGRDAINGLVNEDTGNITDLIDKYSKNPENERVLKSLLSVIEYESNLPLIYEELDSLKKQVEEKHDRLTYLQTQLVEYQSILLQIEGLTNENQD